MTQKIFIFIKTQAEPQDHITKKQKSQKNVKRCEKMRFFAIFLYFIEFLLIFYILFKKSYEQLCEFSGDFH